MCGIAGIVHFDDRPLDPDRLGAMRTHLNHRGPDEQDMAMLGRCGLVHTRLSIVDLSHGRQPMHLRDAAGQVTLSLTFNGEIYNHRALRRELESLGHRFASDHCDSEVLLHGYRQWGLDLPARLEGMFAAALWDAAQQQLILLRDRTGKKPLYVHHLPGRLHFASLVGTLLVGCPKDLRPGINPQALATYLRLGYTTDTTLHENITELPAGCMMAVDRQGRGTVTPYWHWPAPEQADHSLRGSDLIQTVGHAVQQAVDCRLEADVPLGCFLSGGIDSSVIAAMAQRTLARQGQQLRTFSVAMPGADYDESSHAAIVARHIGSHHTQLQAGPDRDVITDLTWLIRMTAEPTADSSLLPTYWLSRAAREHVKVALSGDGGDELFAGYDRYRALRLLGRHGRWLRHVPTGWLDRTQPKGWQTRLARLLDAARFAQPASQYQQMIHLFNDQQLTALGLPQSLVEMALPPLSDWPAACDPAAAAMQWDRSHYLPFDLLRKMDRASMAVALEVRCPLLDRSLCELAGRVASDVLMPDCGPGGLVGSRPKAILRDVAATLLPASIVQRPKRGFAIPIGRWFADSLHQPLRENLLSGSLDRLGLSSRVVAGLLDQHVHQQADHTHRLFGLLTLVLWEQQQQAVETQPA